METGRYWVRDLASNRKFCVEPIAERDQKIDDRAFTNGGFDGQSVKNKSKSAGGSVHEEDSIITKENGFETIEYGSNPMDVIDSLLKQ